MDDIAENVEGKGWMMENHIKFDVLTRQQVGVSS